ncbi:MAG: hypothetical protein HOV80_33100, partial [Polyangiaceae bacterium]|nr:hypothetical protein [Polyangiaceae bacterium]
MRRIAWLGLFLAGLIACSDDGEGTAGNGGAASGEGGGSTGGGGGSESVTLLGAAEKGPMVLGSSIAISALDGSLAPTGLV